MITKSFRTKQFAKNTVNGLLYHIQSSNTNNHNINIGAQSAFNSFHNRLRLAYSVMFTKMKIRSKNYTSLLLHYPSIEFWLAVTLESMLWGNTDTLFQAREIYWYIDMRNHTNFFVGWNLQFLALRQTRFSSIDVDIGHRRNRWLHSTLPPPVMGV